MAETDQRLRIILLSHYHKATTGFARITDGLITRLAASPEFGAVAQIADGEKGEPFEEDGISIFPLGGDRTNEGIANIVRKWGADVVIVLFDAFYYHGIGETLAPVPVLRWLPIDSDPATPDLVPAMKGSHTAIAMSRFGLAKMQEAGVTNSTCIPCGVEDDYKVMPDRLQLAGDDCSFLVGCVSRNYPTFAGDSKCFPHMLRAWAAFASDKPDTVRLYLHTNMTGLPGEMGVPNLLEVCRALKIENRVCYPGNYSPIKGFPRRVMCRMYNSCDVLLATSGAEGFGLPPIEAQACGVPVVTSKFGPMTEHVHWGRAVEPIDIQWSPLIRSWWSWPDVKATTAALNELYAERQACGGAWPMERRLATSAAVHAEYGLDHLFEQCWAPLLRKLASTSKRSNSGWQN